MFHASFLSPGRMNPPIKRWVPALGLPASTTAEDTCPTQNMGLPIRKCRPIYRPAPRMRLIKYSKLRWPGIIFAKLEPNGRLQAGRCKFLTIDSRTGADRPNFLAVDWR